MTIALDATHFILKSTMRIGECVFYRLGDRERLSEKDCQKKGDDDEVTEAREGRIDRELNSNRRHLSRKVQDPSRGK